MASNNLFLRNGSLRLHAVDSGGGQGLVPLLIVPGLAESADEYAGLIKYLAPRRCVAVTLRGRGRSDAPPTGYALQDHLGDIAVAAALFDRERFCLFGFSRCVAYALGYALEHAERLAGLIVGDYPARHSALPPEFTPYLLASDWHGRLGKDRIAEHALDALQRESRVVMFWDRRGAISCRSLILHGTEQNGSLLSNAQIERYRHRLPQATAVCLTQSGHDLWAPAPVPFNDAVRDFLAQLDADHR